MNPTGARKCCLTCGVYDDSRAHCQYDDFDVIFMSDSAKRFDVSIQERSHTELFLIENCSYFSVKLIKQHVFKSKCNCGRKSMQEQESTMVLQCKLKIPSFG